MQMPATSLIAVLLSALSLSACSSSREIQNRTNSLAIPFAYEVLNDEAMAKWSRSCALCHVNGEGGAPLTGDTSDWNTRLAQGEDTVLQHIIQGYNQMPPLGYCMACEVSDFMAMTAFMAGGNR